MKKAAAVIAPNEFLAEDVRSAYGISPVVIHNPCDLSLYGETPDHDSEGSLRIVYTGQIGQLHFAAFRNLATALRKLEEHQATLHLYAKIDDATSRVVAPGAESARAVARVRRGGIDRER